MDVLRFPERSPRKRDTQVAQLEGGPEECQGKDQCPNSLPSRLSHISRELLQRLHWMGRSLRVEGCVRRSAVSPLWMLWTATETVFPAGWWYRKRQGPQTSLGGRR